MHPDRVSCHPSWRCRSRWGFPDQSWSWAGCDSHGSWCRYYCCFPWIVRSRSGSRADLWSFWRGLDCLVLSKSWWNRSYRGSNLIRQGKCEKSFLWVLTIFDSICALVHLPQPFLALQVKLTLLCNVKRAIIILMNLLLLILLLVNLLDVFVVL